MAVFHDVTDAHAWRYEYDRGLGWRYIFAIDVLAAAKRVGHWTTPEQNESIVAEVERWCEEQFGIEGRGFRWKMIQGHHAVAFKEAEWATAFKVRWC